MIKPCPFCDKAQRGGFAFGMVIDGGVFRRCVKCGATGPEVHPENNIDTDTVARRMATRAWNQRPTP